MMKRILLFFGIVLVKDITKASNLYVKRKKQLSANFQGKAREAEDILVKMDYMQSAVTETTCARAVTEFTNLIIGMEDVNIFVKKMNNEI